MPSNAHPINKHIRNMQNLEMYVEEMESFLLTEDTLEADERKITSENIESAHREYDAEARALFEQLGLYLEEQ